MLDSKFSKIFDNTVPDYIEGFECEDADAMSKLWPAGSDAAREVS